MSLTSKHKSLVVNRKSANTHKDHYWHELLQMNRAVLVMNTVKFSKSGSQEGSITWHKSVHSAYSHGIFRCELLLVKVGHPSSFIPQPICLEELRHQIGAVSSVTVMPQQRSAMCSKKRHADGISVVSQSVKKAALTRCTGLTWSIKHVQAQKGDVP